MATNYTYIDYTDPGTGRAFNTIKTPASNIQLVNLRKQTGAAQYIRNTSYYGMNAGFFVIATNKLLNIAYQDGVCIGSGVDSDDGYTNAIGESVICWTGSAINQYNPVITGGSSLVPKTNGSWAQGGLGLFLGDPDWESKYGAQLGAGGYPIYSAACRTGILINTSTKYVYLFECAIQTTLVYDLRHGMMSYAGITDSGLSNTWKAIMTDGGRSTQMYCKEVNSYYLGAGDNRPVPQIIALKNKN